jgi:hypothetical protein
VLTGGATCGNGVIEAPENCDGNVRPSGVTGGTCDANTCQCTNCQTTGGDDGKCKLCTQANCADQRTAATTNPGVDPVLDCVLGPNWPDDLKVTSTTSCAVADLLACYCGTLSGQDCASAPITPGGAKPPVNGQCVQQVLTATGCADSSCVAPVFLNPSNDNGKAMQYVQCKQDFCYGECFPAP